MPTDPTEPDETRPTVSTPPRRVDPFGGITLYHYDPDPDPVNPLAHLGAGDHVYAVFTRSADGEYHVGDRVEVVPMVVGTPPAPAVPTRWQRLRAWVTRRPVETEGEFVIRWSLPVPDEHDGPTQPPAA